MHGAGGIKDAVKRFRAIDETSVAEGVSPDEFFAILKECGAPELSPFEKKHLLIAFDNDNNGRISLEEFLRHLSCRLNSRRLRFVNQAYETFLQQGGGNNNTANSSSKGGSILASTLGSTYKSQSAGGQTKSGFDRAFAKELRGDAAISREEFIAFYAGVAILSPMSDDEFEALVLREWGVDNSAKPRLNETKRDWTASTKDGKDPLAVEAELLAHTALSTQLGTQKKGYENSHLQREYPPRVVLPDVNPDYITTITRSYPAYTPEQMRKADPYATTR